MSESKSVPSNPPPPPDERQLAKLDTPFFLWPATAVLAALLFFGLSYLIFALTHESTDDAFIAAHVVSVAPRVAGQVAAVHVLDNAMVRSNELLVEIDPATYAITVA
jgi:membrane fusion protein, multidrug efflux system